MTVVVSHFILRATFLVPVVLVVGCSSAAPDTQPAGVEPVFGSTRASVGSIPTTAQMIGSQFGSISLTATASDPDYGYTQALPIKIGGGFGSKNHYAYLNSLAGPNGEELSYERVGSCCSFETSNSPLGAGMLEVFALSYEGATQPRNLYFDWYNASELLIPVGLRAKAK